MDTEYEAKFYPVNKTEIRKRLKKLKAKLVKSERKMKRALFDNREYPQIKCHYLRVRDEGDLVRISAKVHAKNNGKIDDQKELDVIVDDYEKALEMFEILGFNFSMYQETTRETWELNGATIEIDTWPGLETYVEIEAGSEEEVKSAAEKIGFRWKDKRITSVTELFMEIYRIDEGKALNYLKKVTFGDNPFAKIAKVKNPKVLI